MPQSTGFAPEPSRVDRLTYSPAEAASVIGISRARLYQLMDDGTIPSLKLGRRRLIRREARLARERATWHEEWRPRHGRPLR